MSSKAPTSAAGPLLRLAAMAYEAVLLFGVVFITGYAVLALARWTYPLSPAQRWTLQAIEFVVIGLYFSYCWSRSGQTLAMKSWRLRVLAADGRPPTYWRAWRRYLLAWTLFAPGLLLIAVLPIGPATGAALLLASLLVMLAMARLDPQRRLLHDLLTRTRVVRER